MNPLAIKYGLIALALIGWTTGVYFYATGHEARIWKTLIAEQKAEAEKTLREANAKAAQENERNAQHARDTDEMYQSMLTDAYAGRDDFAARLRERRRASSCSGLPGTAPATGGGQDAATRRDDGPSDTDSAIHLRDAVMSLQAYSVACHSWAASVGR